MTGWIPKFGQRLFLLAAISLVGGLLGATLVRFAPGYGMDERELDPRLSQASREAIRNEHRLHSGLLSFYGTYLARAAHGDFGRSEWLHRPIAGLLKERFPITMRSVILGVLTAWVAALLLSLAALFSRGWFLDLAGTLASGFLIALPGAVVALFEMYLRAPVFVAIGVVTFPKIFRYLRNLLNQQIGVGFVSTKLEITFPTVSGAEICQIEISPALQPAIVKVKDNANQLVEKFFVRSGNSSVELLLADIPAYMRERFK